VRKPDPEICAVALHRLRATPSAAVHVGDDLVLDVMGAQQAGLRVVYVRDNDDAGTASVRPDR